jgi:hypothetical protein
MKVPFFWDTALRYLVCGFRKFEESVIEISETDYLLTHHHIAGERNPQLHSSKFSALAKLQKE